MHGQLGNAVDVGHGGHKGRRDGLGRGCDREGEAESRGRWQCRLWWRGDEVSIEEGDHGGAKNFWVNFGKMMGANINFYSFRYIPRV